MEQEIINERATLTRVIGTYNNPPVVDIAWLQEYFRKWAQSGHIIAIVGQIEEGEQGTPHV